jgi:hypothetical protein
MATDRTDGPDQRFGMLAPVVVERQTATPGGLVTTVTESRAVDTAPGDLLDVHSETRLLTVNGLPFERLYDGLTRTLTETTPEGRTPYGRAGRARPRGLDAGGGPRPVTFGRDATVGPFLSFEP